MILSMTVFLFGPIQPVKDLKWFHNEPHLDVKILQTCTRVETTAYPTHTQALDSTCLI